MKKITILFIATLLFGSLSASHIPGGNISYTCIGTNPTILLIKTHIYVGCGSVGLPSINLQLSNDCGLANPPITTPVLDTTDVTSLCSSSISVCDGGTINEWKRYNFESIVTLPDTCDSWKISYTTCCRPVSNNLATIGDVYLETTVNTSQFNCENSPVVQGQEIPYFCAGQTNNYCIPAYDIDGDSLYFELTDARQSGGVPIPYTVPYSSLQPLQNVVMNGETGCLTFNQSTVGMYHVAVRIHSFKNGIHVGYVTHDFPIMVYTCSNSSPSGAISNVTGGTQTGQNTIDACLNMQLCFDISFTDPNIGDTLSYDSLLSNLVSAYPSATINSIGSGPLTVNICWTPTNLGYYYGTPFVNDNACPFEGVGSFTTIVNVVNCLPTGIELNKRVESLRVYPSPKLTTESLIIELISEKEETIRVSITDITGKLLLKKSCNLTNGQNKIEINNLLPKGVVMLKLETNEGIISKKLIIQ